jgi:DNA-binding NarL/FixJ family response regulator
MKKITLLLADRHTIFRQALAALLMKLPDVGLIHETATGDGTLCILQAKKIDVVLFDTCADSYKYLLLIKKSFPRLPVIAITWFEGDANILNLAKSGVRGILLKKNTDLREISIALKQVLNEKKYFTQKVNLIIQDNLDKIDQIPSLSFTFREHQLISCFNKGFTAKEVATETKLTLRTVESYRKALLRKTHTSSTIALLAFAYQNGFL